MTTSEVPVLIVGGGPVGLALAAELGWRGIKCFLVEQTDGVIRTPKMNEVNIRTMEYCRRWGIADQVLNCPFPGDYAMDIAFVTSLSGFELARQKRPAKFEQQPGPHSPVNQQICSQLWFDPILREFAQSFPTVSIAHRCRMENFRDTADSLEAEIHHLEDGRRETIRIDDGTPDVADDPEKYIPSARPGARAPHVELGEGHSTLDLFGRGFVLLNFGSKAEGTAFKTAASSRGVPLEMVHLEAAEAASVYQRRMVLVRPDGHVAWRGEADPGDAGAVLDRARGAN